MEIITQMHKYSGILEKSVRVKTEHKGGKRQYKISKILQTGGPSEMSPTCQVFRY